MITIVAIGKKHEPWVAAGIERYSRRLQAPFDVKWVLLPHSAKSGLTAREEESGRILSHVNDRDFVIVLDERGKLLTSPGVATIFQSAFTYSKPIKVVIGGAYGVNGPLMQRADLLWSLSPLVFPHQLVRLILTEQLYRFQEIAHGRPYHHE